MVLPSLRAGVIGRYSRVLQGVDLLEFFLVRKINKKSDNRNGIARADHLAGQGVATRAVISNRSSR
jgi:hypothetical protein